MKIRKFWAKISACYSTWAGKIILCWYVTVKNGRNDVLITIKNITRKKVLISIIKWPVCRKKGRRPFIKFEFFLQKRFQGHFLLVCSHPLPKRKISLSWKKTLWLIFRPVPSLASRVYSWWWWKNNESQHDFPLTLHAKIISSSSFW